MNNNEVTIFLTPIEAEMFKSWQQFHNTFALLCSKGVFDTKNGSVTIHFGPNSEISSIIKQESIFNARIG